VSERIGITSTVPVEVILAAGKIPVDLNNLFIGDPDPLRFIRIAEEAGYPRNICAWIRGLFGLVVSTRCVDAVIALTQGDCSSTLALVETLLINDVPVIPFEYPFSRDRDLLRLQIEKLSVRLGTTAAAAQGWVERLRPLRRKLAEIDSLTWREGVVTGEENHRMLLSSSDFGGDVQLFEREATALLERARQRKPHGAAVRLGYIGVPPVWNDLHSFIEAQGARVALNEMQRQFSMPFDAPDLVRQYLRYTYPYGVFARLEDIEPALSEREVDGVIHYTQSFCFRQIEDLIFRKKLSLPILTLEGDQPGPLDGRPKLRIGAFIEMLRRKKQETPGCAHAAHKPAAASGKDL
jgi:benzoyl-CoA reductase/2-hydroxyglutaryl-CoA dehydratase subunit BcrC/BadD/HgdB